MAQKVIAVKEEGSRPQGEGILARFAQVCSIRGVEDIGPIARSKPTLVFLDLAMAHVDATAVLKALQRARIQPVVLLNYSQQPSALLNQIGQLAGLRAKPRNAATSIGHIARVLQLSQESLARVLHVSSKTVQRWLKGTKPRPRPELVQLARLVSILEDTFPTKEAVHNYLNYPNPSFSGEKPIELVVRGEYERIEADLQAIQEGVYA